MRAKVIGSNMAEISIADWTILISYETPVAANHRVRGFYRTSEKFSSTTTRHINKWLDGVRAKIVDQDFFDTLLVSRL